MKVTHYRRDTCRLCGSRQIEISLRLTPTPPADAYVPEKLLGEEQAVYPLDLYLCHDCGFSQLSDVIHPESIYLDYIYETKSSLGLVEHFKNYAGSVVARINPPPGSRVVDIGSNDGTLLQCFKDLGYTVLGVDPAREIAHSATARGVETLPDFFTGELSRKIKTERGPAAIITANNIFANVDELDEITDAIRDLLSPDGVFVFESFYLADLLQNMVFDFTYHEHLSYFSVKPLVRFFRSHGMELIDAERIPTKGGSLRYTVQLAGGPRSIFDSIAQLIAHEDKLGLDQIATYTAYADKIAGIRDEVTHLLDKLRKEGKRIDGFGASATTTTLIYHFRLGQSLGCIYDDYPAKQHLFSPGFHIPVLPPEEIANRKPDYILIIAWRYVRPIIEKNPGFAERGGRYIVPLPALQII